MFKLHRRCFQILFAFTFLMTNMVSGIAAEPEIDQNRFALLVGINDYVKKPLKGCENDVRDLRDMLVKKYRFAADDKHIKMILTPQATKKAIEDGFKTQLIENAKRLKAQGKKGVFLFQFSGHGSQVADTSGDEPDYLDETLCTLGSSEINTRDDILDDDFQRWVTELSRYTNNITIFMDCCNSGTNTRAVGFNSRQLDRPAVTKAAAVKEAAAAAKTRALVPATNLRDRSPSTFEKRKFNLLPPSSKYVALSACMAGEPSLETPEVGKDGKPGPYHGMMTRGLLSALSGGPISYDQLWTQVSADVKRRGGTQSPQLEGNGDRILFDDTEHKSSAWFRVTKADAGEVMINGGTMNGVIKGGMIAFYKPSAQILSGDDLKITTGDVTDADAFSAIVKLKKDPDDIAMTTAKAVCVTPNFGKGKLTVALPTIADSERLKFPALSKTMMAVTKLIKENPTLASTPVSGDFLKSPVKNWNVAIVQGDRAEFVKYGGRCKLDPKTAKQKGIFLVSRDGGPLYNFFCDGSAGSDNKILEKLKSRMRQEVVLAFNNSRSALADDLDVKLQKVTNLPPSDEELSPGYIPEGVDLDSLSMPTLKVGEGFRFGLRNKGTTAFFVTGVSIGTDGSITVLFPQENYEEKVKPSKDFYYTAPVRLSPPAGIESVQLIVTAKYVNFKSIEQEGVLEKGLVTRDLDSCEGVKDMLVQSMYLPADTTRSLSLDAPSRLNDWFTKRIDYRIRE